MDEIDRRLLNALQGGFPLCERPYAQAAGALGISEAQLIERLARMLQDGVLTRFGPMFNADRFGGGFELCAMRVPPAELERVAAQVNAHPEVAHNYEREHDWNMWFVLAAESPPQLDEVRERIARETGYAVLSLPKAREFVIGLRLEA